MTSDQQKYGKYRLVEPFPVGGEGFGLVYKVHDPDLDRIIALKVPHQNPYLAMEFVDDSLSKKLKGHKPLPYKTAVEIAIQVCEGLAHAHQKMIHRDIKPSNILITEDGTPKIADFGLARATEYVRSQSTSIKGTPSYMSPEQWRGGKLDERTDMYSLGIVLYEMLTGNVPFASSGQAFGGELQRMHESESNPPMATSLGIPAELEEIVRRATAKDRNKRFKDMAEMALELRAVGSKPVPPARTKQPIRPISEYDKAIKLDPQNAKGYNNRGIEYGELGMTEMAERDLQKAKELGYSP